MSLRGKTIAFSGTFENFKRSEVVKAAKAAGATVNAAVSKNIDYLIAGESNVGIKEVQAEKLGVTVIPPHSFLKFVGAGGSARVATARQPRAVEDFEEDYEEEHGAAMPWETTAPRRAAKRRQVVTEVDFDEEEEEVQQVVKPRGPSRSRSSLLDEYLAEDNDVDLFDLMTTTEPQAPATRRTTKAPPQVAMQRAAADEVDDDDADEDFVVPKKGSVSGRLTATTKQALLDEYLAEDNEEDLVDMLPSRERAKMSEQTAPWMSNDYDDAEVEDDTPVDAEALLPWENEVGASATKIRRSQKRNVEEFDQEIDVDRVMPWESADVELPRKKLLRPVRGTRSSLVNPRGQASATATPPWNLRSKVIAFTGAFEQITKPQATVLAERNGADVVSSTAHVDILVCGRGSEAKRLLAKKKGILAVSENSFIAACRMK